jgi:hypothetical protein
MADQRLSHCGTNEGDATQFCSHLPANELNLLKGYSRGGACIEENGIVRIPPFRVGRRNHCGCGRHDQAERSIGSQ